MNNSKKLFGVITIIAISVATTIFVFKTGAVNTNSLQTSKSVKTSVKEVEKRIVTPDQARNFLNDLDMPTRDYEKMETQGAYGQYEADSDGLILETRDPNRFINNLSYSVFGDKSTANAVELDLNVNDISFSSNAVGELIKYSDYLMYKVTDKHLTPQIKKSMQTKTSGEWLVDGYKIKLKKETFPVEEIIKGEEPTSDPGAFSLTFIIEL